VFFNVKRAAALAALAFVFVSSAYAQPGALSGSVKDSDGGILPGVSIRVIDVLTGAAVEAVSGGDGGYTVANLAPGTYRVEAALDGFEQARTQVTLAAAGARADVVLQPSRFTEAIVVTARRIEEQAQDVPIPVSVIRGDLVADAGAFNVNRMKEMLPTVQFYSTNARNSAINIRGLGAPFGLTNDGLEPGVGMYVDGVFYARPASATLDFLDVEQVEVLRGPQGTLFGKNTTAGAINVTTKKPSFTRSAETEINVGNLGFVQAKASVSGRLVGNVAGRLSFSGTGREGTVRNVRTGQRVNNLDNLGFRGQVLFARTSDFDLTLSVDQTRQRVTGNTQVIAGVAPTLRPANRQWAGIIADLNYTPPSYSAFDRVTDVDSPLRASQDLGGGALSLNWTLGPGRLTSTTAWRYWNWNPSSDRDFIGLPVTTVSAAPSNQQQWTQELRYAATLGRKANVVGGLFYFNQRLDSDPSFTQEQGAAAWRFLLSPSASAATPGLLDGYGYTQDVAYRNSSAAAFGQIEWAVADWLQVLPGLRVNYDTKRVDFSQQTYGGLQTTTAALLTLQQSVLAPQAYKADAADTNTSGQLTVAIKPREAVNVYATYATSFKSVGMNLNGVPTDAANQPVLSSATVKPEHVHHYEAGVKTQPFRGVTANLTAYDTDITNFQTQVVNASVGVLRGYLANAARVRVRGMEFDGTASLSRRASVYANAAYTDGRYVSFTDAPPPLEQTGGPQVVDVSGTRLPGISRLAVSVGGEYAQAGVVRGRAGQFFVAADTSYRSRFSASPSESRYMFVPAYGLVNARVGFRAASAWTVSLWARNLLDAQYFDLLTAAPGNSGLIVGQPGDPRTFGVTLRLSFRGR
jgi:iron complex outermembrane receptor protein